MWPHGWKKRWISGCRMFRFEVWINYSGLVGLRLLANCILTIKYVNYNGLGRIYIYPHKFIQIGRETLTLSYMQFIQIWSTRPNIISIFCSVGCHIIHTCVSLSTYYYLCMIVKRMCDTHYNWEKRKQHNIEPSSQIKH